MMLRWLERGDGHDDSPIERTLQYGVSEPLQRPADCDPQAVFAQWHIVWYDVPTVRHDAASSPRDEK